jgi:hypothetical protein
MIYGLYTVYDKVAEEAGPVFQAKNDGVALRNFQGILQSQHLNPDDYKLIYLADYDSEGKGFPTPVGISHESPMYQFIMPQDFKEITPNKVAADYVAESNARD